MLTQRQLKKIEVHGAPLLHWTWSCQLQLRRLVASLRHELSGAFESPIDQRKACSQTSLDQHLLFVAARHLLRELERAGKALPDSFLSEPIKSAMKTIRDAYEHPHDLGAATRTQLASLGAKPGVLQFGGQDGLVVGRVIVVRELHKALDTLERLVLDLQQQTAEQRASTAAT